MPILVRRSETIHIGEYLANKLKEKYIRFESDVPIPLDTIDKLWPMENNDVYLGKKSIINLNSFTDKTFLFFFEAYNSWNLSNKDTEFISIGDSVTKSTYLFDKELLAEMGVNPTATTIEIEVGLMADKIRNGEIVITDLQREILESRDFLFDVEEFIIARNVQTLIAWAQANPDLYLATSQIAATKKHDRDVLIPAGTALRLQTGEQRVLRVDNKKTPSVAMAMLTRAKTSGKFRDREMMKQLDDLGIIWDNEDFRRGRIDKSRSRKIGRRRF